MATTQSFVPSFRPFVIENNPTSVGKRWDVMDRSIRKLSGSNDIKDPTRKRAMQIHFAGEEVHKIFRTLEDTGEGEDYDTVKTKLTEHFKPQQNIEYRPYVFGRNQQNPNETLDQYRKRLKHLASTCEFADESTEIKSQIILQCMS